MGGVVVRVESMGTWACSCSRCFDWRGRAFLGGSFNVYDSLNLTLGIGCEIVEFGD